MRKLAKIHDPSGVSFNVAPIKSKENKKVEEVGDQASAAPSNAYEGVNPERLANLGAGTSLIEERKAKLEELQKKGMSKTQLKKQLSLLPKPVPLKPTLPEGIEIPLEKGEENFLALWDLTDQQILDRLANKKRASITAKKAFKKKQQDEAKINKRLKNKKRHADKMGLEWDREAALKEIEEEDKKSKAEKEELKAARKADKLENGEDGDSSDSGSESESDSDSDLDNSESEEEAKPKPIEKEGTPKTKKSKRTVEPETTEPETVEPDSKKSEKSKKRPTSDSDGEEPKSKKSKKSKSDFASTGTSNEASNQVQSELQDSLVPPTKVAKPANSFKPVQPKPIDDKARKRILKQAVNAIKKLKKKGLPFPPLEELQQQITEREEQKRITKAIKKTQKKEENVKTRQRGFGGNDEKLDKEIAEREGMLRRGAEEAEAQPAEKSKKSKKRKHDSEEPEAVDPVEKEHKKKKSKAAVKDVEEVENVSIEPVEKVHKKKKSKAATAEDPEDTKGHSSVVSQWNPDALEGGEQRKSKFLRLLGAGKGDVSGAAEGSQEKNDKGDKRKEIDKVQKDLEKQYEASIKMKHEHGGKRRGLGA